MARTNGGLATQERPANGNVPAKNDRPTDFLGMLERSRGEIAKLLPDPGKADRVVRIARTAFQTKADLQKCTPQSIIESVMKACELNLEPDGARRHAYLVPFGGKCTLIIGYPGFIELAERAKIYAAIETREIHEKDRFSLVYNPEAVFSHSPFTERGAGCITHVYSYARKLNGALIFETMTWDEVENIKRCCTVGPAWKNYPGEMAKKVVLKRMLKRQPCSVELAEAIEIDNALYDMNQQGRVVQGSIPQQRGVKGLAGRLALPEPEFSKDDGVSTPLYTEPEDDSPLEDEDPLPEGRMAGE